MSTLPTLFLEPLAFFLPLFHCWGKKFAFKIKTEPVTQAAIIIGIVAFSSGSLATIAVYLGTPSTGIVCAVILAVVVYLALRLAPC
jgi:hypothetical protein